jgi:hypothetical protein
MNYRRQKSGCLRLRSNSRRTWNGKSGEKWFTKAKLAGLSDDVVERLEKRTSDNEGKVRLLFKYPDIFLVLYMWRFNLKIGLIPSML